MNIKKRIYTDEIIKFYSDATQDLKIVYHSMVNGML